MQADLKAHPSLHYQAPVSVKYGIFMLVDYVHMTYLLQSERCDMILWHKSNRSTSGGAFWASVALDSEDVDQGPYPASCPKPVLISFLVEVESLCRGVLDVNIGLREWSSWYSSHLCTMYVQRPWSFLEQWHVKRQNFHIRQTGPDAFLRSLTKILWVIVSAHNSCRFMMTSCFLIWNYGYK